MRISDWSSDVCSSDLTLISSSPDPVAGPARARGATGPPPAPSGVRAGSARCRDTWYAGSPRYRRPPPFGAPPERSEEHTSELQSLMRISYAVFCLKKKKKNKKEHRYKSI